MFNPSNSVVIKFYFEALNYINSEDFQLFSMFARITVGLLFCSVSPVLCVPLNFIEHRLGDCDKGRVARVRYCKFSNSFDLSSNCTLTNYQNHTVTPVMYHMVYLRLTFTDCNGLIPWQCSLYQLRLPQSLLCIRPAGNWPRITYHLKHPVLICGFSTKACVI